MGYHHKKIKVIRINSQFIQLSQLYKTIPNIINDLLDCWEAHIRQRKHQQEVVGSQERSNAGE